jgi:hypothetical protein
VNLAQEMIGVGHMLDHLDAGNEVEAAIIERNAIFDDTLKGDLRTTPPRDGQGVG